MTVGKGQTQRKLGETPASLLWDLPFLLLLLFICQGLRQGSHPQQGRECMTKKSRVGKCQRRSGCGRAEAELPIPASDIYIGRDATKAKRPPRQRHWQNVLWIEDNILAVHPQSITNKGEEEPYNLVGEG